jgi:hypothetical protein
MWDEIKKAVECSHHAESSLSRIHKNLPVTLALESNSAEQTMITMKHFNQ